MVNSPGTFRNKSGIIPSWGCLLLFGLLLVAPVEAAKNKPAPADEIFKDNYIPSMQIQVSAAGMSSLKRNERKYIPATIRVGTVVYTNVALRLKGGPGSFRPVQDKPAFTLNFERFAPGQRFYGLKKIHLNNSVQDESYLSEKIGRELFEAAGVPVPRAGNALVEFNGRRLGLYVLVEGINNQFLHRYFNDVTGNVYDGHSQTDVTDILPVNSGENPRDQSRLRALAAAAQEPDLAIRLTKLEKTLDLDRFISFTAMEIMLGHWDGYARNRNNYRIYHDRDTDRMVFLPQGVDQLLRQTDSSIMPPMVGLVARSVLEIPDCRQRYRERVSQLLTNVFRSDLVTNRIARTAAKIEARMREGDPTGAYDHKQLAADMIRRFDHRAHALERQLSHPVRGVEFDRTGAAVLTDWWQKIDSGNPRLTQQKTDNGEETLQIALQGQGAASWRKGLTLSEGHYRLIAKIKTEGVVLNSSDPKSGAGLRISGRSYSRKYSGDMDWTLVMFDFEVPQESKDVEFVCELRGNRGEIWFDLKSLKLIRK